MSFNPRAHAGRDQKQIVINMLSQVSIHAPTRGATYQRSSQESY